MSGSTNSSRRNALLAVVVLLIVVAVFWWWRGRGEQAPAPASKIQPSATAAAAGPAAGRRSSGRRALQLSARSRKSIHLGEATTVDEPGGRLGRLEGKVIDWADREPVAHAHLSFDSGGVLHAVQADDQGRFSFQPTKAGWYELAVVTAEGYLPFAPEWGHSPLVFIARPGRGIRGAEIFLTPAVSYLGIVIDPEDKPVANAQVRVLAAGVGDSALASFKQQYKSDAKGEFRFIAPDDAIVEASHEGYAPARARLDFAAQVSHRLILKLTKGKAAVTYDQAIRGIVVDAKSVGVPDSLVVARYEAPVGGTASAALLPPVQGTTNERGEFELFGLATGQYTVFASNAGYAPTVVRDVPAPSDQLRLVLRSGTGLMGMVSDAQTGRPIPSFVVVVAEQTGALGAMVVATESAFDPEGRYEVEALAPGKYRITILARGYRHPEYRNVTIGQETVTEDFKLDRGR